MGLLSLIYLICALRTNIVFVTIFFGLFMTFVLLAGSYWHLAMSHTAIGAKLQIASGSFAFLACLAGWYVDSRIRDVQHANTRTRWILFAQMLASVDFPYQIPVGDISHLIQSGTSRLEERERYSA